MPGIVGIIPSGLDNELLEHMISSLMHEEWYQIDKYLDSFFGVARVHLGIFNPEPQPIFNEDKSLCIFMDGKIYDYKKEMNELKVKGHKFSYCNDPEFCLHLYEEYGKDFVKKLNGDFVIAICDLNEEKLLLANDRYGLRPLYYAVNNDKLLFAPEIKAILQDKTFKREINDEAIAEFFAFGEFWGDKTLFKGAKVLPPASIFIYDGQKFSVEQYWHFDYNPDYSLSEGDIIAQLIEALKKAVKIRMKDNLRYGVALSGGLDSRSVVAAIDPERKKNVLAYTFGPRDCNEVKIAKEVAKRAGIKHLSIDISPELLIDNAEQEVWLTDGRDYIGVSFAYPISKLLKDKIDVVFDGFALDLILGGSYLNESRVYCKNEDSLFNELFKKRLFSEEELCKLFVSSYYHKVKDIPLKSFKREFHKIKAAHPGNKSDQFFLSTRVAWIPIGYVFIRDMLEISNPTVDNNFIDIILKIPPEWRLNHYIYRKFLKTLSPELAKIPYNHTMIRADAPFILWKAGTMYLRIENKIKRLIWKVSKGKIFIPSKKSYVEFNDWLRTNEKWKRFFKDLLLDKNAMSKTYFNQEYIKTLIQEHEEGKENNSLKILYLASFELFLRLFMNYELTSMSRS